MSDVCKQLHEILSAGKRFEFSIDYDNIPKNGIYVMFEKGESAHGVDRIVRIGTHSGDNQLRSRIYQHFELENKNRSIFRKNIGRCILNQSHHPYLSTWELDTTSRKNKEAYGHLVDKEFEQEVEKQISSYIQQNFSFVILEVATKEDRLLFESRLIGTVSNCNDCAPSENWFGYNSPVEKIRKSGLWQVMELYAQPLSYEELEKVKSWLAR